MKTTDNNRERGPGGIKVPAFYFFLSAGTGYKTPGHDHKVINT